MVPETPLKSTLSRALVAFDAIEIEFVHRKRVWNGG
jgi:hypothetical protein